MIHAREKREPADKLEWMGTPPNLNSGVDDRPGVLGVSTQVALNAIPFGITGQGEVGPMVGRDCPLNRCTCRVASAGNTSQAQQSTAATQQIVGFPPSFSHVGSEGW